MPKSVDGDIRLSVNFDNNGIQKGVRSTESAVSGLKSSLRKLGTAAAAAFSVKAVVNFSKQAIDLASDVQEVQNVVDVAFGDMAYKCEEFANAAIENFGMSKLSAKRTASTYMAMAKSMGLSMDAASEMAIETAKLTGDVASFYNLDQEAAATKLKGIFTGESEALKELGVVMTETNLQEYALSKGITTKYSAMTQAEKVMLRYEYVTNALSDASGDFVRTQDSWANQTRILSERWKELMSTIGSSLITVLTPLLQLLNDVVAAMISFAQKANVVVNTLAGVSTEETDQSKNIAESVENQNALTEAVTETAEAQKRSAAGFDEINKISNGTAEDASAAEIPVVSTAVTAGKTGNSKADGAVDTTQFNWLFKKLEELKAAFGGLRDIDLSNLKKSLEDLKEPLQSFDNMAWDILIWAVEKFLVPLANFTVNTVLPKFLEGLKGRLEGLKNVINQAKPAWDYFRKEILKPITEFATNRLLSFWDFLNTKLGELEQTMADSEAWQDFKTVLEKVGPVIVTIINAISFLLDWITKFVTSAAVNDIKSVFRDIGDVVGLLAAIFTGDFDEAWKHLKDLLVDNRIQDVKERFNSLKTAISDLIAPIKEFGANFKESISKKFSEWGDGLSEWWNNSVKPWFTKEKWEELFFQLGEWLANAVVGAGGLIEKWKTNIATWWDEDVTPWFTKEKWIELWNSIVDSVKYFFTGSEGFVQTWKSKIITWWDEDVKPWFTVEKWKEFGTNLKEGFLEGLEGIVNGIKGIVNKVVTAFESLVNSAIDMVNGLIKGWNKVADVTPGLKSIKTISRIDLSKYKFDIPALANGAVIPANKPFLSVLGDQRSGTNIETPLATMIDAFNAALNARGDGKGEAVLELDGERCGRLFYRLVKKEGERVGVNFSNA